jgi:hypothetical protein
MEFVDMVYLLSQERFQHLSSVSYVFPLSIFSIW